MAISLGDINFGLGVDTQRLDAARQAVLSFGREVSNAARRQTDGAREAEAAMRRQEKAMLNALQTTLKLNDAIRATGASSSLINSTTTTYNRLVREMGKGQVSALAFQRAQEDFQASTGRVNRELARQKSELAATAKAQVEATKAAERAARIKEQEATRALRAEESMLRRVAREQERATQRQIKLAFDAARAQETQILRSERAYHQATIAVDRFSAAVARIRAPASLVGQAQAAQAAFTSQMGTAGTSSIAQQRATQQFQRSMGTLNNELARYRKNAADAAHGPLEAALRRLADVSILLHGPLSGVAARLTLISSLAGRVSITAAAVVTALSAVAFGAFNLGRGAVEASRQIDRADQALTSLHGSATIAALDQRYLLQLADRAGVEFGLLTNQYTRLTAASKNTNLEGEATRTIFENMVMASARLGSSNEELGGVLKAIEQIMSKGVVQAEELRGQLGDRLPGAVGIMAEALGIGTKELGDMMKQGRLTSSALLEFSQTVTKRLGVDVTQAIMTVTAVENRLTTAMMRFSRAADEAVGFTDAYKLVLTAAANTIIYFGENIDKVVQVLGGLGAATAAVMAAIYGPAVISGFIALANTIRIATAAMLGFNVAVAANPLGAIATLLTRVAVAAVAGYAGYKLLEGAVENTGKAHFGALPAVQDYIKAQENLKSTIRATNNEYIAQQQILLQQKQFEIEALSAKLEEELNKVLPEKTLWEKLFDGFEGGSAVVSSQVTAIQERLAALGKEAQLTADQLSQLFRIGERIDAAEKLQAQLRAQKEAQEQSTRTALAIKEANDAIRETGEALRIQNMPKYMQEWARVQLDVNSKVENFRDRLTRAKVPAEEIILLTQKYAEVLRGLEEGKYYIEETTSAYEILADTLGKGVDDAFGSFVDGVAEGKNAMEVFQDAVTDITKDILKTLIQFSVANPLKNWLFNGNIATGQKFPTIGGMGQGGGILGSLFGGGANVGSATATFGGMRAKGGPLSPGKWYIAGENGPEPVWGGGSGAFAVPSNFTATGGTGRSGVQPAPNVMINIQTQPGEDVEASQESQGDGMQIRNFIITTVNTAAVEGRLDRGMGSAFGLQRPVRRR